MQKMSITWAIPCQSWSYLSDALVPQRLEDESSREYWERVDKYVRSQYGIPSDATIIIQGAK